MLSYVDERQRRQNRRGKRNVVSSSSLTRSNKHHCREKVPEKKEKKVDVTESNTTTNLDNLIEGLLATSTPGEVSEKKPETVSTSSESTTTTTTESEKENVPEKVEKKVVEKKDVLASLTISGPMGSVSLVSYAKETYDKSCQTMPPRRLDTFHDIIYKYNSRCTCRNDTESGRRGRTTKIKAQRRKRKKKKIPRRRESMIPRSHPFLIVRPL